MSSRPRTGRPPKAPEERRSEKLEVMLTSAEADGLQRVAQHFGTTKTQLVRGWIQRLVAHRFRPR